MKVKSESEAVQSCPTLSEPMGCILPGCSVHGIFQARGLEWGAIAFSGAGLLKAHGDLVKMQILVPMVWGGACDSVFLTSSQVILVLLIHRPHFEWCVNLLGLP